MKTVAEIMEKVIEHRLIGEQHSVMIHDLKSGKNIRYPVTTKSDAEYVAGFLRTVLCNTHENLSALSAPAACAGKSEEPTEVPPSVTGPTELNNPGLETGSPVDTDELGEDESHSSAEQLG